MTQDPYSGIRRLIESLEPAASLGRDLAQTSAKVEAALAAGFAARERQIAALGESMIKIHESIQRPLTEVSRTLLRLHEQFEQLDADERELMRHLAPRGWVMSPSMVAAAPSILLRQLEAEGLDAVESTLIEYFSPSQCREMLQDCYEHPAYRRWQPRLDEALGAHERGEFGLAIPIWFMSVDGIAYSELEVRRIYSELRSDKKRQRIEGKLAPHWGATRGTTALLDVLKILGEPGDEPVAIAGRRNLIMHGRDPDYANEVSSIQGIVLLESLCQALTWSLVEQEGVDAKPSEGHVL